MCPHCLLTLLQVPIFPKAGQGFDATVGKLYSTVTVCYDPQFRIVLYCPADDGRTSSKGEKIEKLYHEQLCDALLLSALVRPPATETGAVALASDGIPAVAGGGLKTGHQAGQVSTGRP